MMSKIQYIAKKYPEIFESLKLLGLLDFKDDLEWLHCDEKSFIKFMRKKKLNKLND